MGKSTTKPDVFIIELLTFENEKEGLFEGKILSKMLHLSDKKALYYYIRTKIELEKVLDIFWDSGYRYLHLSCHGNSQSMATTIDDISFEELSELLEPVLENRRLFLSACSMANAALAKLVIPKSDCYSIIGPANDVNFNDAAILWSSFYHLMFQNDSKAMKRNGILKHSQNVSSLFNVPLNYYSKVSTEQNGFKFTKIKP